MASKFGASFLFLLLGCLVVTGAGLGVAEEPILSHFPLDLGKPGIVEKGFLDAQSSDHQKTGRKADLEKERPRMDQGDGKGWPEAVIREFRRFPPAASMLRNSGGRIRCRVSAPAGRIGISPEAVEDPATVPAIGSPFVLGWVVKSIIGPSSSSATLRAKDRC